MLEGPIKVAVAERLADDERVQRQRHDATRVLGVLIELIELVDHRFQELRAGIALTHEHRHIVEFYRVGNAEHPVDVQRIRLIVVRPVQDVVTPAPEGSAASRTSL